MTYGDIASDAAGMPVPDPANVQLKDEADFHHRWARRSAA